MLARVDEQLLMRLAQAAGNGRGLDELRPVADYGEDLQRPSSDRIRALNAAAVASVTGVGASKLR